MWPFYRVDVSKWNLMSNKHSVDPDQTPCSAASDQSLHFLHRPICQNTYGKYGTNYTSILFSGNLPTFLMKKYLYFCV